MAKPNYQFEKRQRDLAKKARQEEKRQKKLKGIAEDDGTVAPNPPEAAPATPPNGETTPKP
jgi:hypothetical protein